MAIAVMRLTAMWCFVWSVTPTAQMQARCGCGPHDVSIRSPGYTVYQLLGRSVNLQLHSPEQFDRYSPSIDSGSSGLQHDEIQDLFANKTFDRRGQNIHVNLVRSEYGGIQGSWDVRKCGEITQGEYVTVTIKIGDAPTIYRIRPQTCEKKVTVCAKAAGTPPPSVVVQYGGRNVTSVGPQNSSSQFCSTFSQSTNTNSFNFSIVASNCLGQHIVVFDIVKDGESLCQTTRRSYRVIPESNASCTATSSNVGTNTGSPHTPCPTSTSQQSTEPGFRKTLANYVANIDSPIVPTPFTDESLSQTETHSSTPTTTKVPPKTTTQDRYSDARTPSKQDQSTTPAHNYNEHDSHSSVSFVVVGVAVGLLTGIVALVAYVCIRVRGAAESGIYGDGSSYDFESGLKIKETSFTEDKPPDITDDDKMSSSSSKNESGVTEIDSDKAE